MINEAHRLYYAAFDADQAWSLELHRLFGKRAGDVRYTARGRGEPGSKLNDLHKAFRLHSDAWLDFMRKARETTAAA